MDSPLSTPITFSHPGSLLSDTERVDGRRGGNKDHRRNGEYSSRAISDSPDVIDMKYSDIELRVNNTIFKTHKHVLSNFVRFEEMIQTVGHHNSSESAPSVTIYRNERGVEDIRNTFKILYASVISGPFCFEPPVLISALRIATVYDFPNLRAFSIQGLEKATLGPIQRIQLAREFDLSSWEGPAFAELSKRDTALTDEEAQVLGIGTFVELTRAREGEKLKRGKELGEQEHKEKLKKEQEEREKAEKAKKEAEEKSKEKK